MITKSEATIEDLYKAEGKAEIVNGEIVPLMPTGDNPHYASQVIMMSLWKVTKSQGFGRATGDNAGFVVDLPRRKSFSPDAAYYLGPRTGMRFFEGAPVFAVEVRSEGDYGPKAESEMAEKRGDYFAAGTQIVWDVDLLSDDVVRKYSAENPQNPVVFRHGEMADAEPAVPGWRLPVDELFEV